MPISNAAKVRKYLEQHPDASGKEVAEKFGIKVNYVYVIRSHMKSKAKAEADKKPAKARKERKKSKWTTTSVSTSNESLDELVKAITPAATDVDAMLKERGERYGTFTGHARVTQYLKWIIYDAVNDNKLYLDPDQYEAIDMICHKLGRIVNGDPNYADSWFDIAGYAKLVADRLETGAEV